MTIGDAKRKLSQVGLESVTDGANTVVLDQLPPAGAKLVKGGHVMLYTAGSEELTPEELVCVPELTGLGDGAGVVHRAKPCSGRICTARHNDFSADGRG